MKIRPRLRQGWPSPITPWYDHPVLWLCIAFITFHTNLPAQNSQLAFERIAVHEQLPAQRITSIYQDKKGFLWIGTFNGLVRYDGYSIKTYRRTYNTNQNLLNAIWSIFEDKDGILWLAGGGGLCRYDRKTDQFKKYKSLLGDPKGPSGNYLANINQDENGQLWIASLQDSISLFEPKTETFQRFFYELGSTWFMSPAFVKDRYAPNTFWIGTSEGKLVKFQTDSKKFTQYTLGKSDGWIFQTICHRKDGSLWMGGSYGLWTFDPIKEVIKPLEGWPALDVLKKYTILSLIEDSQGIMWIGTAADGLYEFDPATGQLNHHQHDPSNPGSISDNNIVKIYEDRSGLIWIATYNGLNYTVRKKNPFQKLKIEPSQWMSQQKGVGSNKIFEDSNNALWVSTEFNGLYQYDRKTGISRYAPNMENVQNVVYSFYEAPEGELWMGMNGKGLIQYNLGSHRLRSYAEDSANPKGLPANHVTSVDRAADGKIWLGTFKGISELDPASGQFRNFPSDPENPSGNSIPGYFVNDILIDRKGQVWAITEGGVGCLNPLSGKFLTLDLEGKNKTSPHDETFLHEDSKGVLWMGGPSGLARIILPNDFPANKQADVTYYSEKEGLIDGYVSSLMEDKRGQFWLLTYKGLSVLKNPHHSRGEAPVFKNYEAKKDMLCSSPIPGSGYQNKQGVLFFGTSSEVVYFHPDSIQEQRYIPPVVITGFSRFDAAHSEKGFIELPEISGLESITLSYQNNIFTIEFAALDFLYPSKNRYSYQMSGFDDNWIDLGAQRQVTFTNLDPGTYTFRVKGTNSDGVWSDQPAVLTITILPPWWRTWWAYVAYFALFVAGVYTWVKMRTRSLEVRAQELEVAVTRSTAQIVQQKEQLEIQAGQLRELDRMKSNFYTNITHEFRTPLTVILGMADQMESYFRASALPPFKKGIELIRRNGKSLLKLINELLDLSKLDSGSMHLDLVQGDISRFISYVLESFQSLAASKNIRLTFHTAEPVIDMDFDQDKLQRIVSNLVANAIKFTPEKGSVEVFLKVEQAESDGKILAIHVRDSGIGIASGHLPYIFDRFYQSSTDTALPKGDTQREVLDRGNAGTGIGLALCRELVHLMQGDISVSSEPGEGSEFIVRLPIHRTMQAATFDPFIAPAEVVAPLEEATAAVFSSKKQEGERPILLIVEDNPDVAFYLQICVAEEYDAILAHDGQQGIDLALEHIPDLIISDVMMPKKDGFELCETLKNDTRTSHIPILLLTAKADAASRIEGLTRGADVYLAKPFDKKELLVQLQRLLQSRRLQQARYSAPTLPSTSDPDLLIEDRFLTNIQKIVAEHLSDETFGIEELAAAALLSSSQLFRKIKALTGQSPALYLRSLRLQKAMALLKNTSLQIAEIAYQVGFSDPAYFSRTFTQQFGQSPSNVRKGSE